MTDITTDLLKDNVENIIDSFLEPSLLKDLPIIGNAVSILKIKDSISDRIFIKKLNNFLFSIRDIEREKIDDFYEKINTNENYKQNVGEKLIELIDRIDSEAKPQIIGNLFKAVLLQKIDYEYFLRLSNIVENSFYYDLTYLREYDRNGYVTNPKARLVTSNSLLRQMSGSWDESEQPPSNYTGQLTDIAIDIIKYGEV